MDKPPQTSNDQPPIDEKRRAYHVLVGREGDGSEGFADYWVAYRDRASEWTRCTQQAWSDQPSKLKFPVGSAFYAAAFVANSYEPLAIPVLDIDAVTDGGGMSFAFGPDTPVQVMVPPQPADTDKKAKHLALLMLVDSLASAGERLPGLTRKMLAKALGVSRPTQEVAGNKRGRNPGSFQERRKAFNLVSEIEGRLLARGKGKGNAAKIASRATGFRPSTIKAIHSVPHFGKRREEVRQHYPDKRARTFAFTKFHEGDSAFRGDTLAEQLASADQTAARLIERMQNDLPAATAGNCTVWPKGELRWQVLHLIEGLHRRGFPPSETVRIALAWALGLFKKDGCPASVHIEGVEARQRFIRIARIDAKSRERLLSIKEMLDAFFKQYPNEPLCDEKAIRRCRQNPFYQFVIERLRAVSANCKAA